MVVWCRFVNTNENKQYNTTVLSSSLDLHHSVGAHSQSETSETQSDVTKQLTFVAQLLAALLKVLAKVDLASAVPKRMCLSVDLIKTTSR